MVREKNYFRQTKIRNVSCDVNLAKPFMVFNE